MYITVMMKLYKKNICWQNIITYSSGFRLLDPTAYKNS